LSVSLGVHLPLERFQLGCGARLLVSRRPGAPVTALQMHVRGGHSLDQPGLEGTAYLTGALLDQGTERRSEEEIAEALETRGGAVAGESNGLSASIASRHWKLLVEIVSELVTEPTYPRAEFRRQKQRLLDRLVVERDEPRVQAERLFKRLVYGEHWLGRGATGTLESVARIERKDVAAFHRRHWVARRAIFAVCGDVEPEEVFAALDRALSRWEPGEDLPHPVPRLPPRAVRVGVFRAAREQVHLFLGHLGVRRAEPDYPALVVMDHVLGTGPGFTNRVAMRLRDELGLAYSVHANIHGTAGVHPGVFAAYIGTSPDKVATAVAGFLREMRRIQEEPVGGAELSVAKDYVVGSFALSFQRAARRASYLISAERYHLPEDYLDRAPREFAAVTPEDVQRAALAHLHPDACCLAAAGPLKREDLQRAIGR
jgi:zinc protease